MKNTIVSIVLVGMGLASTVASASWSAIKSETGNHCIDQGLGHLRFLFGESMKMSSKWTEKCHSGDSTCNNWIQTNLCEGYFVVETVRGADCSGPHYGFVPMYVKRIWAYGDCSRVLTHDAYPRYDNTDAYIHRPN